MLKTKEQSSQVGTLLTSGSDYIKHRFSVQHSTRELKKKTQFKAIKNEKLPNHQLLGMSGCMCMHVVIFLFGLLFFIFGFKHFQYIYVLFSSRFHHSVAVQCSKSFHSVYSWNKPHILRCQKNWPLVRNDVKNTSNFC